MLSCLMWVRVGVALKWLLDSRVIFKIFSRRQKSQSHSTSSLGPCFPRKGRAGLRAQLVARTTLGDSLQGAGRCAEAGSSLWSHGFLGPLFSPTRTMAMREIAKYSNQNHHYKFWLIDLNFWFWLGFSNVPSADILILCTELFWERGQTLLIPNNINFTAKKYITEEKFSSWIKLDV